MLMRTKVAWLFVLINDMTELEINTLLNGNDIFCEFKGALTEQYVLQQICIIPELAIYYWSSERSTSELDFIIQYNGQVIPIEVKAEENLQAKSLKVYCEKYSPPIAIRTSMSDYREEDWLTNLPLYALHLID